MKSVPSPFTPFTESRCPDWLCPICTNQTLRIKQGSFHYGVRSLQESRRRQIQLPEVDESYVFSCLLECIREGCSGTVAVSGEGWTEIHFPFRPDGLYTYQLFRARSFTPPLPLFLLPVGCPEKISRQLTVISSLLTLDGAAAANAIRCLLEILMDVMGAPEAKNLHRRIHQALNKFGDDAAAIHALKAVGNAGSHGNEITRKDLEEACLVLESVVKKFCHAAPDISHIVERLEAAFTVRK